LISLKVKRVVVGVTDTDTRVFSRGIQNLRNAGIELTLGVLSDEIGTALKPYLHHRTHLRPWCVAKIALSIDGKNKCADGSSQWITGEAAREDAQILRAKSQAILVGSGTALLDNPRLNARVPTHTVEFGEYNTSQLLRVLLDGRGRVTSGHILDQSIAPTLVFTTEQGKSNSGKVWSNAGIDVCVVNANASGCGVDLQEVMNELGKRGIIQTMVEGGGAVHSSLLAQNLVDELVVYHGPKLLGSSSNAHETNGWPANGTVLAPSISLADSWKLCEVRKVGDAGDYVVVYERPVEHKQANGN